MWTSIQDESVKQPLWHFKNDHKNPNKKNVFGMKLPNVEIPRDCLDVNSVAKVLDVLESALEHKIPDEVDDARDGEITAEELLEYPEPYRVLNEYLRTHTIRKNFETVAPFKIKELIMECRKSLHDPKLKEVSNAVWSYGTSPRKFYLKWAKNLDQSRLLQSWITAVARKGNLDEIKGRIPKQNEIVAAEFTVDKCWYRAEVLDIRDNEVRCHFIDYGNEEVCTFDQLRKLPGYIVDIPRLAFPAKLVGNIPSDEKVDGDIMLDFICSLKNARRLKCKTLYFMKACVACEVLLWDAERPQLDFSELFRSRASSDSDSESEMYVSAFHDDQPVEREKEIMPHSAEEFPHHPPRQQRWKCCDTYRISNVIDPDEIYVQNQSAYDRFELNNLQEDMKIFYDNPKWKSAYKIRTSRVIKNRNYAWLNRELERWERIRVVRTDTPPGKAYVQRIDHGDKKIVRIDDMMELNPRFWKLRPVAQLAHLVHVKPPNGSMCWSRRACRKLQELMSFDKTYSGVVFTWDAPSHNKSKRANWNSLGLVLSFDKNFLPFTIQGLLVALGIAEGTGVGAGHPFLPFPREIPKYKKESETGPVSTEKRSGEQSRKFDLFIRGDVEELIKMNKIPNLQVDDSLLMQETMRAKLGWIEFSVVNGPGHLYLHSKLKQKELFEMMAALEEENLKRPSKIEPVDIVGVRFSHELDSKYITCWNRAVVLKSNPNLQQAKVILLDFGIETHVRLDLIVQLPEEYLNIPSYCCRAHLDIPGMMPAGGTMWSGDATYGFVQYVRTWKVVSPVYLGFRRSSTEGIVHLSSYDQTVEYDPDSQCWRASEPTNQLSPTFAALNQRREHKLLQHLYSSIGFEIYYEDQSGPEELYSYQPVWNKLTEGFVVSCNPPNSRTV